MKRRSRLLLLLLVALVMALSYLAGALAPPLRGLAAATPGVAATQWQMLGAATDLLLNDDEGAGVYLPIQMR